MFISHRFCLYVSFFVVSYVAISRRLLLFVCFENVGSQGFINFQTFRFPDLQNQYAHKFVPYFPVFFRYISVINKGYEGRYLVTVLGSSKNVQKNAGICTES